MKYWVFENEQIEGPYDPDELSRLPAYSAKTLVCPEGRRGDHKDDWLPVGVIPELLPSLMQSALTVAGRIRSNPPAPPREAVMMEELQDKVALLDNTIARLQEEMRYKDGELARLYDQLEEKNRAAEREAASTGEIQRQAVAALLAEVEKLKAENREREAVQARAKLEPVVPPLPPLPPAPPPPPPVWGADLLNRGRKPILAGLSALAVTALLFGVRHWMAKPSSVPAPVVQEASVPAPPPPAPVGPVAIKKITSPVNDAKVLKKKPKVRRKSNLAQAIPPLKKQRRKGEMTPQQMNQLLNLQASQPPPKVMKPVNGKISSDELDQLLQIQIPKAAPTKEKKEGKPSEKVLFDYLLEN